MEAKSLTKTPPGIIGRDPIILKLKPRQEPIDEKQLDEIITKAEQRVRHGQSFVLPQDEF